MLWVARDCRYRGDLVRGPHPGIHYCLRDADQPDHRGLCGGRATTPLKKLHVDPASRAGMVTTVTDVVGFLAFLGLAPFLCLMG